MNTKEIDILIDKCLLVIVSCENDDQLRNAIKYCNLAIRKLSHSVTEKDERIKIMKQLWIHYGYAINKVN